MLQDIEMVDKKLNIDQFVSTLIILGILYLNSTFIHVYIFLVCKVGVVSQAKGSAYIEIEKTKVICAV